MRGGRPHRCGWAGGISVEGLSLSAGTNCNPKQSPTPEVGFGESKVKIGAAPKVEASLYELHT